MTAEHDARRQWLALYVLCAGVLMIVLDTTIVNVALPSIREDLAFSATSLVWVVNAYMCPSRPRRRAPGRAFARQGDAMLRVLLPVDGSESSTRAVQMAVQMYQRLGKVEVLLLHVEVADGVPATALAQGDQRAAAPADPLAPAKALLDAAGVPHTSEMRRGYVPPVIAEYASVMRCDAIVMSPPIRRSWRKGRRAKR